MMELLALTVVVLFAAYLIGLAVASVVLPDYAARFLNAFASSARAHYIEMSVRLIVGVSIVVASPQMRFADIFYLFGWLIVATSVVLLLLPWRWHNRFARIVVPPLTKRVWLFGFFSLPLGGVILYAAIF